MSDRDPLEQADLDMLETGSAEVSADTSGHWPPQSSRVTPQVNSLLDDINMSLALGTVPVELFWNWLRSHGAPEETEALYDELLTAVNKQIKEDPRWLP